MSIIHRVFSGIQPTGIPHLGNYFGAIAQWIKLSKERKIISQRQELQCQEPIYCIVDIHAYTSNATSLGEPLYKRILSTTASLLALGLETSKCILFRQSDILEHCYLNNVFDNFVTPQRLSHMTQFKEKSKASKLIVNGLLNYPVLQAADILLYRSNLVPVGDDQTQHIELARDIGHKFNLVTKSDLFSLPQPIFGASEYARRIKSLRDPEKKMSKSDPNLKSFIEVVDEPDVILEKCKKAVTDSTSAVHYDPDARPGVSNLMRLYHLASGDSMEQITENFQGKETLDLKLKLADILIAQFKEPRKEFLRLQDDPSYLEQVLLAGKDKAQVIATDTIRQVKHLMGSRSILSEKR